MGTSETCTFSLDPTARAAEDVLTSDELGEDGEWHCHRSVTGEDYCPFHRDEVQPAEQKTAFLNALSRDSDTVADRERRKQFIGARFGQLDLRHALLTTDDSYPIDLRYATFDGDVLLDDVNLFNKLRLDGFECRGDLSMTDSVCTREVTAMDSEVTGTVDLRDATFESRVSFANATVGTVLGRDTRFRGRVVFRWLTANELDFANATFDAAAYFDRGTVNGDARFSTATARGEVLFADTNIEGDCNVWDATVGGQATFTGVTVGGEAMFADATFVNGTTFEDVTFGDRVVFDKATFEEDCTFTNISWADDEPPRTVSFCDAQITSGTVVPTEGTMFDLTGATIGPVDFCTNGGAVPLHRLRLVDVRFDGFDFRDREIRDALNESDWEIHGTSGDDPAVSPTDLESTYLKAKNGANLVGDDKAAGEFFIKELIFRRHSYYERFPGSSTLTAGRLVGLATGNRLFEFVAGYGERPWRVVANSVLTIVVFAAVFWIVWPSNVPPYGETLGFLVLSVESFVTLLLGGAVTVDSARVRLLAELEGFLGGFLVALFVFTLTRSVHR
jgi:hypothetical protein